jgi:hypothetical protein
MQMPAASDHPTELEPTANKEGSRLTDQQIVKLITFGLVFWLVAALFIRWAPLDLFAGGASTMLLFAVTIPAAWLSVQLAKRLVTLASGQLLTGVGIASAAAMLCDGVGLVWWSVYGEGNRLPGAAWILWGVGCILFAAFFVDRKLRA